MSELGNIRIADEVVKTIAAKAAGDVEGVYKLAGGVVDEVSKMLGKKRPTNGVKVEVGEVECSIEVYLVIKYGYKIPEVAEEVQKAVLEEVSNLTGLKVVEVNVYVQNVRMEEVEETTEESPREESSNSQIPLDSINKDTYLKDLIKVYPKLKDDMIKISDNFRLLQTPLAAVMLPTVTLKKASERGEVELNTLIEKIKEIIKTY